MKVLHRLALVIFALSCLAPTSTLAITGDDNHSINYDTTFYDANSDCSAGSDTVSQGSDNLETILIFLIQKHGLTAAQAAGIAGNMFAESGYRPNADHDKGTATFPTVGDAFGLVQWIGASNQGGLVKLANQMHMTPDKIDVQLPYLWDELTGRPPADDQSGSLKALKAITANTEAGAREAAASFMHTFERPGDDSSLPTRQDAAVTAFKKAKGIAPGSGGDTGGGGGCSLTAANGTVAATAFGFVWPKPDCVQTYKGEARSSCFDARKAYQAAWQKYNGGSDTTDCGAFVATVIIASGVDKNYPKVGTTNQYPYVKNHPKLYQQIHTKSSHLLAPGDILVAYNEPDGTGHTELFVGKQAGFAGNVAAASLSGHTPHMEGSDSNGAIVFILVTGEPYGSGAFRPLKQGDATVLL